MANNANINVSASGLNEILASLIAMQKAMKSVTEAAKKMQAQINTPANPNGGGSGAGNNGSAGNSAAAERLRRESNTSTRVLSDNARRESMAFVSAYAEIASSVFALTAAFTALKTAAQFGVMLTAQDNFTRATGANLQSIAKVMQQTTKYALDFQQAAQFSSIGRLAGFSTEQIKKLAETGTSAATILGRDVPEALSRMFRGVAKGEPEILDELGIFIRLDNAYKEYIKTVAKGQKVLDLSAYQRRQAPYYAAIKSGEQMAVGNANAKIDDFTIASAQLSTAFKTAMLSVTDVLGPVVKFLSQNTGLLVATIALLGGKVFSNLGNILFNVTAAKNAQAAIAAKQVDNRTAIQDNKNKFTRESTLLTAQANQGIAKEANRIAGQQLITSYKQLQLEKLQERVQSGRLTAAKALLISNKLNANIQNDAAGRSVAARAASAQLPAGAHGPMPGVTAAQQALNTAAQQAAIANTQQLALANRLVAVEAARASAVATTGWGRLGATVAVATGYVNSFTLSVAAAGAAIKTAVIGGIAALGALIGAFSILFMAYVGGKALLDYFGAFGKNVKSAEDALKSAGEQMEKVMVAFNKLGKVKPLDMAGSINNAKVYSNALDSMGAELDSTIAKLKEAKESNFKFGRLESKNAAPLLNTASQLLPKSAQASILAAVAEKTKLEQDILNLQNKATSTFNIGANIGAVGKQRRLDATKDIENMSQLVQAAKEGKLTLGQVTSAMIAIQIENKKIGETSAAWAASLEGANEAISALQKSFGGLAKTLMSESPYTGLVDDWRRLKNEITQGGKAFAGITAEPTTLSNTMEQISRVESALTLLNKTRTSMNMPLLGMEDIGSDPTTMLKNIKNEYDNLTKAINTGYNAALKARAQDVSSTNALTAKNLELESQARIYKNAGVDISSYVAGMQKVNDIDSKIAKIRRDYSTISNGKSWLDESDTNFDMLSKDSADNLKALQKQRKESVATLKDMASSTDIGRDALEIPINLKPNLNMQPFLIALKQMGVDTKAVERNAKGLPQLLQDIEASITPLKTYKDIVSETKSIYADFIPTSTLESYREFHKLTSAGAEYTQKELDAEKALQDMLAKKYAFSLINAKGFSLEAEQLSIFNDELSSMTSNSEETASKLSNIFSGMNLDVATKIAEMESKLRTAAVTNANKTTDELLVHLQNRDLSTTGISDPTALAYKKASDELHDVKRADVLDSDKLIALKKKLAVLEVQLRQEAALSALQDTKNTKATTDQINTITKTIKEAKWSNLMIDAAKEVTSAWEDVRDTIARGAGKDGGSIADSIKGALGKGRSGILDGLTAKISKGQDAVLGPLKDKAKNFFLGSKDDKGNKIPGALSKLGDTFTKAFPKTSGILGGLGGLEALKGIFSKDEAQRNSAIGGTLGSVAGTALGAAFTAIGGPLGGAIGSVVGNIIGNTFGKKLKETGFEVTVSKTGEVFANELQVFKKTTLLGTRTINNIIGKLDSESAVVLQQAINGTRDTYVSSLLQYNKLTAGAFNLSLDKFRNFSYSNSFLQQAGGNKDSNELLKNFVTDYGNKMGEQDLSFLYQFRIATESIVDVLKRLVATIRTTETAFHTMFGSDFKGPAITAKEYIGSYAGDTDNTLGIGGDINSSIAAYDNAHKAKKKSKLKKLIGGVTAMFGLNIGTITAAIGSASMDALKTNEGKGVTAGNALSTGLGDIEAILKGGKASNTGLVLQGLQDYIKANSNIIKVSESNMAKLETLALMERALKNTTDTASMEKILQIARADYYSNLVAAFDGANTTEKETNYNKALATYTNMVAAGVTAFSNSYSGIVDSLYYIDTKKLPDNVSAIKNNLLMPIQEYNKALQLAVETEASPVKIAEAIKLGAKLAEVIQSILDVFSSINISEAHNAATFSSSVVAGIGETFKQSAIENFKKSLLAPLLADAVAAVGTADSSSNITYKSSLDSAGYVLSGDIAVKNAKDMLSVLSDKGFNESLASVSAQFDRLISTFDKLDTSKAIESLAKTLVDITKTLKESAYSFAVSGDEYSVALFKAREAFKAAGLSSELAYEPISSVVSKMKDMASSGKLTTDSLDSINEALNALSDASLAARGQIQTTLEASQASMDASNTFMTSLVNSIIDDSGSFEAAKSSLAGLLDVASSKVDRARAEYAKARASGNLLAANQAAENLTSSLESYVNQEIDANNTLKTMAEDRYNAEKTALDNVKTIISDIANFVKDLKFDDELSILKPIDRLTEAASNFDNLRAKVFLDSANGQLTPEAVKTLQEESKRLLDLGRDVYSSGAAYTDLYSKVMAAMSTVDSRAQADILTKDASTKMYQDMALAYAKDNRDIQVDALSQLKILTKASAVDNAIAVDMINALKYNQGLPQSVTLSDYYKQLFSDAQGGGTIFTQPNTGYQEFNNVGTYDEANKVAQEVTNAKLNLVLETLTTVLQNLPVNVKSAIQSTATPTTNRN